MGELTLSSHVLKAKDVHIGLNKNKLLFVLHSLKTHCKANQPQTVKISGQSSRAKYCPFQLLGRYLEVRPTYQSITEKFFIFRDRSPAKPSQMRKILKTTLSMASCIPAVYGIHGMHEGRARYFLKARISVETIKKLGRWKSSAVYTYLR